MRPIIGPPPPGGGCAEADWFMPDDAPTLFALANSRAFAGRITQKLRIAALKVEERNFDAGGHKTRPLENVPNRDVYGVRTLNGDEAASGNEKQVHLDLLIAVPKGASAVSVTTVPTDLCHARKDRNTQTRYPVNARKGKLLQGGLTFQLNLALSSGSSKLSEPAVRPSSTLTTWRRSRTPGGLAPDIRERSR